MLEQIFEDKLITKIQELITDCDVYGFWKPVDEGNTQTGEPPLINVFAGLREIETESLDNLKITVSINLVVPMAIDPMGIKKAEWSKKLIEWLVSLNGNHEELESNTYSDDTYSISGCKLEPSDCSYDSEENNFYIAIPVTFFVVPV